MRASLSNIVEGLKKGTPKSSLPDIGYIRRSLVETFGSAVLAQMTETRQPTLTSAKIIRNTEEFIALTGTRPVHISELCAYLHISRRSLHRAFAEVLGIGPMAFVRRSRLTVGYSILKNSDPATTMVGDVASELGFIELGRFAQSYKIAIW